MLDLDTQSARGQVRVEQKRERHDGGRVAGERAARKRVELVDRRRPGVLGEEAAADADATHFCEEIHELPGRRSRRGGASE